MLITIWLLLGFLLASVCIAILKHAPESTARRMMAVGLVVAALIYLLFTLPGGDSSWMGIEALGVLLYGLLAWLGLTRSVRWLAAGWAAHPLWDVLLHQVISGSRYAPEWYVFLCLSFDVVIAIHLFTAPDRMPVEARTDAPGKVKTS